MTWQELVKKAKELGYNEVAKVPYERQTKALVNKEGFAFYRDGTCEFDCDPHNNLCGNPFIENRTPKQMYAIMEGLQ